MRISWNCKKIINYHVISLYLLCIAIHSIAQKAGDNVPELTKFWRSCKDDCSNYTSSDNESLAKYMVYHGLKADRAVKGAQLQHVKLRALIGKALLRGPSQSHF